MDKMDMPGMTTAQTTGSMGAMGGMGTTGAMGTMGGMGTTGAMGTMGGMGSMGSMGGMGSMSGMNMGDMGMKMYYHLGFKEHVLFSEFKTLSVGAMVGACFAIWALGVLYEGLKFLREELSASRDKKFSSRKGIINHSFENPFPSESSRENSGSQKLHMTARRQICDWGHFLQTFLHIIQIFVSYCLMLVAMTFNVWLCLAVCLGAGTGYFLFGWKRRNNDSGDCC